MSETDIELRRVAILGGGGREYEIGRAIAASSVEDIEISFLPGNGGTDQLPYSQNVAIDPADSSKVLKYVMDNDIGLTIIGSENHIVTGTPDLLRQNGLIVFAPSALAALMEAKKSRGTEFMKKFGVPYPDTLTVYDMNTASDFIRSHVPGTYVMKADGLCAGKGVDPFDNDDGLSPAALREKALQKAYAMHSGELFGEAGKVFQFQTKEFGDEISVVIFFDGKNYVILPISQDHKRLGVGDTGDMTGGNGAYAPVPRSIVNEELERQIIDTIVEPTVYGLQEEARLDPNFVYRGAIYAGLMLTADGPKVIEYNVRPGDPETEAQLPVMAAAGVDSLELFQSTADGSLDPSKYPKSYNDLGTCALSVVLSACGYPKNPQLGAVIHGLDKGYDDVIIQQAGTRRNENAETVVAGGRAVIATGVANDFDTAADSAEAAIGEKNNGVYFDGMQSRPDIGWRVREQT
ncbi:MAG TPA: phosphoribosylamine--glycine ligase [Candidatus Saccharimonadales bacterium]|jgi:phosphoribosylamine--glycine ligase